MINDFSEPAEPVLDRSRLPRHVAVIMDGNGRWAQARGMPRTDGHRAGVDRLEELVRTAAEIGLPVLTVFAFSTENWRRSPMEVQVLFRLAEELLRSRLPEFHREGVRLAIIGDRTRLPAGLRRQIDRAEAQTSVNQRLLLNIALNYGGRADILQAVRRLAEEVKRGELEPNEIDEELFASRLYTAGLPDPDLLIRTGGEFRLSNFLLWSLAYTEIWVTERHWPDFGRQEFLAALAAYQHRQRRFGRVETTP